MKKHFLFLAFCCLSVMNIHSAQAQTEITYESFKHIFGTGPMYVETSCSKYGNPVSYMPSFTEYYYEITKTEVLQYAVIYSGNKYTAATVSDAVYDASMVENVTITRVPITAFDPEHWKTWGMEAEYEENDFWRDFYKDDKGVLELMEAYNTPSYDLGYMIKKGKVYQMERFDPIMGGVSDYDGGNNIFTFKFRDKDTADSFVDYLKNATN